MTFISARWLFIISWIISVPLIILGTYFELTVIITILLEGIIGTIYAIIAKKNIIKLISIITIGNTITQIGLVFIAQGLNNEFSMIILVIMELIIWIVESIIIYLTHRQTFKIQNALLLSLLINLVSFASGILLPV